MTLREGLLAGGGAGPDMCPPVCGVPTDAPSPAPSGGGGGCAEDIDGDGSVNVNDLLSMLSAFGSSGSSGEDSFQ